MRKEVLHDHSDNRQTFQGVAADIAPIKPTGLSVGFTVGLVVGKNELSERDHSIILELKKHPVLTALQIKVLLGFPSLDRAQRRCLSLHRKGLLGRMPYFSLTPGRAEYCYFLTNKGNEYLHLKSIDKEVGNANRIKSGMFLNHILLINQFWLSLQLSCRNHDLVSLEGFIPEFGHRNENGKKATAAQVSVPDSEEKLTLIPDAVFCLAGQAKKKLFCLEIDRATGKVQSQSYRSFAFQIKKYIWYQQSKGFSNYQQFFNYAFPGFQVLYATRSEGRIKTYQQALASLGNFQRFVLFTTLEKVSPEAMLGKIWHPSRIEDENLYSLIE